MVARGTPRVLAAAESEAVSIVVVKASSSAVSGTSIIWIKC